MSEKEKKKRDIYRKNREKWIFVQVVIAIVLTLAVLISALVSVQLKKKYYIGYHESGNIDYNVFLKENEFFENNYLGSNQSYVASLIDKVIADFNYTIEMDTDDVNYRYSYKVKSRLEIIDDTSDVAIFNPEYELVNVQNKNQKASDRLIINEIVVLNYDEYNDLANKFLETYSLTKTTSNIVVSLEVDVLGNCEAFEGSLVDTYVSELRIPLTTKTVNIEMTSAVPDASASMIACTRGAGSEVFKTTAIVLGVTDVLMILLLVAFVYFTRTADITYTARVKKILSQYKSYIQKINNLFETHGYQIVLVDTFDEMLEIRDTIQAPILMYENEDKTCAKFMIPTDSKLLYLYEIKVEGYTEPAIEPKPEPVPTTIVKPNITNVVRPIVKVVVNSPAPAPVPDPDPEPDPEPEIETILEDAEVEIESNEDNVPEVIAIVEDVVEETETEIEEIAEETEAEIEEIEEETEAEIEEIEEETEPEIEEIAEETALENEAILNSIPSVEEDVIEENTVEAIDIFWEERTHKTYRYDPDGNVVDQGDIVLVPTRDEGSDKEIVREAEVARGNYKINPETLDHPLKKIIGVVKRKAEQIFTAMITPEENDSEDQN